MSTILLVGSSGFIGQALLKSTEFRVIQFSTVSLKKKAVTDIEFTGVKAVFYFAGVSAVDEKKDVGLFDKVNYRLALELCEKAKTEGVTYFLYLSSTKVLGDHLGKASYNMSEQPIPTDDYGRSKLKAETALMKLADEVFKICVVRPAAVYGEGAQGNFLSLLKLINTKLPLPLNGIDNKRSMVYVGNLVAFIKTLYVNEYSGVYTAVDSQVVSTSELVHAIRTSLNVKTPHFTLPEVLIRLLKNILPGIYYKLYGSQYYDIEDQYERLGYFPPYSFATGVKNMVEYYKENVK